MSRALERHSLKSLMQDTLSSFFVCKTHPCETVFKDIAGYFGKMLYCTLFRAVLTHFRKTLQDPKETRRFLGDTLDILVKHSCRKVWRASWKTICCYPLGRRSCWLVLEALETFGRPHCRAPWRQSLGMRLRRLFWGNFHLCQTLSHHTSAGRHSTTCMAHHFTLSGTLGARGCCAKLSADPCDAFARHSQIWDLL